MSDEHDVPPVGGELEPASEIVDAEIVELPERPALPVPARVEPLPPPWAAQVPERRPVVAPWLRDRQQRRQAAVWAAGHARHVSAFHGARVPIYVLRVLVCLPRGVARVLALVTRWVTDGASTPLWQKAAREGDAAAYSKLRREATERMRPRLVLLALTVAASVGGVFALRLLPWWVTLAVIAAAVLVLAWVGRPAGRRLIEHAVLSSEVRKLSPGVVARAFIAAKLCTDDSPISFATPIHRDSNGFRVVVDLPYGQTAERAMLRRAEIASGLDIDERQLFLSRIRGASGSARRVSVWACDVDPLAVPAGPSPLARAGRVNFWQPWPFGVDERGETVPLCLVWEAMLVGAIPRQGKTFAARLVALAAALDPHIQIRVHDLKGGPDWVPFRHVAHRLFFGDRPDPDTGVDPVLALLDGVRELLGEVDRRNRTLRTLPASVCPEGKLTEELSRTKAAGMPLVLMVIDEVQRAFTHKAYGPELDEALTDLAKVGPSAGIMLLAATQKPDAKSTPTGFRDQLGVKLALRVTTRDASEAVLGAGAYGEGLDASKLSPDAKGCGLLRGTGDAGSVQGGWTVRTYLANGEDAEAICQRGRALRESAGTLDGMAAGLVAMATPAAYSVAADLATVMATDEKAHSDVLCSRLAEQWPERYVGWEPAQLSAALKPHGVKTRQVWATGLDGQQANRYGITRGELLAALDEPAGT